MRQPILFLLLSLAVRTPAPAAYFSTWENLPAAVLNELRAGHPSPRIRVSTDDPETSEPAQMTPGAMMHATVDVSDADVNALEVSWEMRPEAFGNPAVIVSASGKSATFHLPDMPGAYRLSAFIRDGHGVAGSASLPLQVRPRAYPAVPVTGNPSRFGLGVQRTMALLATSTPEHRNPVRILFYGQSLTKQDWARQVADDLRRRFPYADLTIANLAIGGYSSPFLIRTLPHDVPRFYPDLIVFHDFGDAKLYEEIIAEIRRRTTAEMLLQNDRPAPGNNESYHERWSSVALPALAAKYGVEVLDLRAPWIAYLSANNLAPKDVLRDGAHFTQEGDHIAATVTNRYLVYHPEATYANPVASYQMGRDLQWNDGRLTLPFTGNRLDLVAGWDNPFHAAEADVRIDGKKPSEFPECYFLSRPTDNYAVDWPAVNRVTWRTPPLIETWTLRILNRNADESVIRFEVSGSVTGPDGTGISSQPFVSQSGRVVIDPQDWAMKRAFDLRRIPTPIGFEVKWQVEGHFADTFRQPRIVDPSREYITTVAQGLTNGPHTLELKARGSSLPVIREIRVYKPPLI